MLLTMTAASRPRSTNSLSSWIGAASAGFGIREQSRCATRRLFKTASSKQEHHGSRHGDYIVFAHVGLLCPSKPTHLPEQGQYMEYSQVSGPGPVLGIAMITSSEIPTRFRCKRRKLGDGEATDCYWRASTAIREPHHTGQCASHKMSWISSCCTKADATSRINA